ncbi:MAG: hypothetical protein FWG20_05660 [Candidatus Cloacimonetes bacterium]|nr:hypothetical protein [Candidatus Cloacimonadota bacterium]
MSKILYSFILLLILSCASVPSVNHWSASDTAFQNQFPRNGNIAMQGKGETIEAAQTNAINEISQYFSSQVTTYSKQNEQYIETNNSLESKLQIEREVIISSQMQLFGVRFASDAFYDKKTGVYSTVAYIEINEAWKLFEPVLNEKYNEVERQYKDIKSENNGFNKFVKISKIQGYVQNSEFQNSFIFGQVLFDIRLKSKTDNLYSMLNDIAQMKPTVSDISIEISNDFENILIDAFTEVFQLMRFNTVDHSATKCRVTVDLNETKADIGIMYYPSITIEFKTNNSVVTKYSLKAEREGAVNPNVALRRAYGSLAESVRQKLSNLIFTTPVS